MSFGRRVQAAARAGEPLCGEILEDNGGYVYTCVMRPHDGRNRELLKHRAGAWFETASGRVAVEVRWADPID